MSPAASAAHVAAHAAARVVASIPQGQPPPAVPAGTSAYSMGPGGHMQLVTRRSVGASLAAALRLRLVRKRHDDVLAEPWVQCDKCDGWYHQICALFNETKDQLLEKQRGSSAPFVCSLCQF